MEKCRSDFFTPITQLMSEKSNVCETKHHQEFEKIKQVLGWKILLAYPDFTQPFFINTNSSYYHLGAVISQKFNTIVFYLQKLNNTNTLYSHQKGFFANVEKLKTYYVFLGWIMRVYTNYNNLASRTYNSAHIMHWRLAIENLGPALIYLPWTKYRFQLPH